MGELFNGFDGYTFLTDNKHSYSLENLKVTESCGLESEKPFNMPKIIRSDDTFCFKCSGFSREAGVDLISSDNEKLLVDFHLHVLIQALWHKKKRINKKWLKRYGMISDVVNVTASIKQINKELMDGNRYECEIDFGNIEYHFRPDQKIKRRKMLFVKG